MQGNIAVIGPLADTRTNMPGTWSVAAILDKSPSLIEGLKEMTAGKATISYAKGSNLTSDAAYEERATLFGRSLHRDARTDAQLLQEALTVAQKADVIVAALGESSEMSGESSSRTSLDIPDVQRTLLKELLKTGKPVVLVLFTGRPLTLEWEQAHVPAILNVWFGGSEAAYAIGDVLFGAINPSGKLTMTSRRMWGRFLCTTPTRIPDVRCTKGNGLRNSVATIWTWTTSRFIHSVMGFHTLLSTMEILRWTVLQCLWTEV